MCVYVCVCMYVCVCVCAYMCVCALLSTLIIVNVAAVGDHLMIHRYRRNVRCVAYKALP